MARRRAQGTLGLAEPFERPLSLKNGPGPVGQGIGCGILLIPVLFFGGGWALGRLTELLRWLFG